MSLWVKLRPEIEEMLSTHKCPAMAVGMRLSESLAESQGFGRHNPDSGEPASADTVFGIGSLTKSFTCMAILKLQEAAKLCVDDSVLRYLPELRFSSDEVPKALTLHHLMTHTAGLPPLPGLRSTLLGSPLPAGEGGVVNTTDDLLTLLREYSFRLLGAPGVRYSYSNEGYALLGCIIERVADTAYGSYIAAHITGPAGMSDTGIDPHRSDKSSRLATPYVSHVAGEQTEIVTAPGWFQAPAYAPAGFLFSSASDLMRYLGIFLADGRADNGRVVKPESIKAMLYPHARLPTGVYYGYGLTLVADFNGTRLVEHAGNLRGLSAHLAFVPDRQVACVALANLAGLPLRELVLKVAQRAVGHPDQSNDHVPYACQYPARTLSAYQGAYRSEEGVHVVVWAEEDGLVFRIDGTHCPAVATSAEAFAVDVRGTSMPAVFLVDDEGAVRALFWGARVVPKII